MIPRSALTVLGALSAFSPLPAQSGVLVGVSKPAGYETLWIVRDSARPIRATIPDLLVPRADGWWRLGTTPICSTGGSGGRSMEVLWRARTDSTPVISEICHEVRRGELPVPIHSNDSVAKDSIGREVVRCSWSMVRVKFVSPDHIAVGETSGQTEECEPRGGRWYQSYYVSRFNGDSSLSLGQLARSPIDSLGRLALAHAARELARDEECTRVVENFDPSEVLDIGDQWYPWRLRGRWMPVLFSQIATGDCQLLPVVDVGLTGGITGHDSLHVPWNVLATRVKGLQDAFTSPRGDLVIARVPDSLLVYVSTDRQLGQRVAAVPFIDREIVMIQWVTGRGVGRWNKEIDAMMQRGLPAARIVTPPKDP